jgi:hypothetical protein
MADIKIRRVVKGSVKTLDRAKTLGERMRGATIRTKDKAESSVTTHENSTEEYAPNKVESVVSKGAREGAQQFDSHGKKAVRDTKENVEVLRYRIKNRTTKKKADPKAKDATKTAKKAKNSAKTAKRSTHRAGSTADTMNKTAKTAKSAPKTASRTSKGSIKTSRYTVKVSQKSVKTAAKTGKTAIKTAEKSAKATKAAAKTSAKAARAAAKAARVAVKATVKGIKIAVKAIVSAVKAIIAAVKGLVSAIIAGGWIAVVIIIIIALIALIVGSCFGIFFSNEDTGSEYSMQSVIAELDEEFYTQIENTISTHPHDVLERSGAIAAWEDVLAVYSVKTTTDPSSTMEVASIDAGKKAIIREIFWLMNTISSRTESRTETVVYEATDSYGNVVRTEVVMTKVYLIITVTHKTADEMADHYGFTSAQRAQIAELLSEENRGILESVLSGGK